MYKVVQKLTVSRQILKRWNRTNSNLCPVCNELETVEHIYFDCKRIKEMWGKIGKCIKVEITWKKILFGYIQNIESHKVRNTLFSIIIYCLYKNWVAGIEDEKNYLDINI